MKRFFINILVGLMVFGVMVSMKQGEVFIFNEADAIIVHKEASDTEKWIWIAKEVDGKMVGVVAFPMSKVKEAKICMDGFI